jgi:hypothetical protein
MERPDLLSLEPAVRKKLVDAPKRITTDGYHQAVLSWAISTAEKKERAKSAVPPGGGDDIPLNTEF